MAERIIDATDLIIGRLAAVVAKAALMGDTILIVNCEKAVISGTKERVFSREQRKRNRGIHTKGPFVSRVPEKFVRRIIRGMLPYKQPKGLAAYKRIMCHEQVPEALKGKTFETIPEANVSKLRGTTSVTIGQICRYLGNKND